MPINLYNENIGFEYISEYAGHMLVLSYKATQASDREIGQVLIFPCTINHVDMFQTKPNLTRLINIRYHKNIDTEGRYTHNHVKTSFTLSE